ncbi:uncharacterized protein K460DRAFT_274982 [Cucurbitaria berberidis CBS 394.84]|uniref:Gag1-like clamp domain-containing protein n=1 Tax=Cucurbitaria berberidis CBS 394.84 TaxID=1168544 RepID=A0A9P4GVH1_9PLEO|nr:uncharacterized protein K460DRAFT_274982 [Cucurbitaria berberidis CBS 394.84]KAF1852057.1 hypothetical protein K460DRAFT_274982 [Cucurbitaria berberidis CBS 394.84]
MENNLSAARQAKRLLDDRVRHDWEYPNVPPAWSASDEEVRDASEFRERYYGESDSGDSVADDQGATSPYKFDSPDSIGDALTRTREARTMRRRERLEREMAENEGLRIWVKRRDVWTGAASVKKYGTKRQRHANRPATPETHDLVPVAPRFLATNPIRASITSKAYSDIFQKIVVSARTPSVPINLADMTKALVQGWKDTDEWPPRAGVLDPLAGKKRGITGAAVIAHHGGFMERHPHLEKSVDSVKRILHLNAHHHDQEHAEVEKEG